MEHIFINEHKVKTEENGSQPSSYLERNPEAVEKVKQKFEEARKVGHPKIITLHEAQKEGITESKGFYKDEQMSPLQAWGYAWFDNAYKTEYPNRNMVLPPEAFKGTNQDWSDWLGDHMNNMVFHCIKIQWLVNIIQTEGLYACPQAVLRASQWYCHPGQFRVHALTYTDCDEDFVVWDKNNILPQPEIDYEEWWSRFKHHDDKALFAYPLEDIVEIHVGESRQDLYDKVEGGIECFQGVKPILEGTCDERLEHLFTHGTYEGHGIGIVGHFTFEDLQHACDFHPSKQYIQKESFTLYNNYHK